MPSLRRLSPLMLGALLTLNAIPAVEARGGGGGDFGGGGGGFRGGGGGGFGGGFRGGGGDFGGGGGGGGYRFNAPRMASAPVGGGGGGGGVGGGGIDSWADRPADRSLDQGYGGSHPLYGSGTRSSWTGHNISADQFRRMNDGSWNGGRGGWGGGGWGGGDFNRNINLENNFYNRDYGGWNNDWGNGGYWGSRPWGYGWYNWSPDTWGWWGGASLGWGLAALATGEVITDLVNDAAEQQSPVISVPDSNYQLNYGTVDSVGSGGADFSYAVAGSPPLKGAANCQQGLLDGQVPTTAAQAQLLNAACQVAYGPDPNGTPLPESLMGRLPDWLRELLVLALGGGIAVGAWQLASRRAGGPPNPGGGHHAKVTGL